MAAGAVVKGQGQPNDLLERIRNDTKHFGTVQLDDIMDPRKFVGRAPEQVDEFLAECIDPVLLANRDLLEVPDVDNVNV
jgi:adenylosuccinate lyase